MKYTKEMLEEAVKNNISFAGVIKSFGLKISGGSHYHLSRRIRHYEINTEHFLGQGSNCGELHKGGNRRKSPEEILTYNRLNGKRDYAKNLKRAMIESGVEYKCKKCGIENIWNGNVIILEVHHKDEDILNNIIENLEFLCPNCHSQEAKKIHGTNTLPFYCSCGKIIKKEKGLCRSCGAKKRNEEKPPRRKRKVENRPSKQQLVADIKKFGYLGTGRKYGVSDNSIRKWMRY